MAAENMTDSRVRIAALKPNSVEAFAARHPGFGAFVNRDHHFPDFNAVFGGDFGNDGFRWIRR